MAEGMTCKKSKLNQNTRYKNRWRRDEHSGNDWLQGSKQQTLSGLKADEFAMAWLGTVMGLVLDTEKWTDDNRMRLEARRYEGLRMREQGWDLGRARELLVAVAAKYVEEGTSALAMVVALGGEVVLTLCLAPFASVVHGPADPS